MALRTGVPWGRKEGRASSPTIGRGMVGGRGHPVGQGAAPTTPRRLLSDQCEGLSHSRSHQEEGAFPTRGGVPRGRAVSTRPVPQALHPVPSGSPAELLQAVAEGRTWALELSGLEQVTVYASEAAGTTERY